MEIGQLYKRPCVRTFWPNGQPVNSKARWFPIIGPLHEDQDIIGFKPDHWHIDYRFLSLRNRNRKNWKYDFSDVFIVPITLVAPLLEKPLDCTHEKHLTSIYSKDPFMMLDHLQEHSEIPVKAYYRLMYRRYYAAYPEYPAEQIGWLEKLEEAYGDHRLKPGLICPHRGADLTGIEPVDSVVTCPLHGLRWDLTSGKLVPRE